MAWRGRVLCGRVQHGDALLGKAFRGLAWLGLVRPCPARLRKVRLGAIEALRGLALYGTVLSCPVSYGRARLFEVLPGIVEWGPVRLGQVEFGSAW